MIAKLKFNLIVGYCTFCTTAKHDLNYVKLRTNRTWHFTTSCVCLMFETLFQIYTYLEIKVHAKNLSLCKQMLYASCRLSILAPCQCIWNWILIILRTLSCFETSVKSTIKISSIFYIYKGKYFCFSTFFSSHPYFILSFFFLFIYFIIYLYVPVLVLIVILTLIFLLRLMILSWQNP